MSNYIDQNEKTLFTILITLGSLVWAAIILGTLGTALLFIGIGYVFFIFAHSGFISYLKGSGAIVTKNQFLDLHDMHLECCRTLDMKKPPMLILIHADGMFNALATRFLKKHYVVLFSDIVDALEDHPEALKFYIGHELGHIKRNHLIWWPVMAPVSWLPLIGAGYSRACEITCDKHGRACCASDDDAIKAMAALAVGARRWKTLNIDAFIQQAQCTKEFFMSLHEIISDYPWLSRRIAMLREGGKEQLPARHPLAWILGIFIPRMNLMSLVMIYIAIIIGVGVLKGNSLIDEAKQQQFEQQSYYEEGYSDDSAQSYDEYYGTFENR